MGDYAGQVARYGVTGGLVINIKSSLSIGANASVNELTDMTLIDILGAPAEMIFTEPAEMITAIKKGNYLKAVENAPFMPLAVSNIIKGYREATRGVTTWTNTPVFYGNEQIMGNKMDTILRFMSFNPARIAGKREQQYHEKQIESRYAEERNDIYAKYRVLYSKALKNKDRQSDWMDLYGDIREYNEKLTNSSVINKIYITNKGIKTSLKRSFKPSKN